MSELPRVPEVEALDNDDAHVYHGISSNPFHRNVLEEAYIGRVLQLGITKGKVLDVGCGPGQIAITLAKRFPDLEIMGVDLSREMINIAKQKAESTHSGATFEVCDAANLPFENDSFDLVISHFFMEHIPSSEKAITVLNEMDRVTKPNGGVYVEDLSRPESEEQVAQYMSRVPYQDQAQRQNYEDSIRSAFSYDEWHGLVRNSTLIHPHTMNPPHIADVRSGLILFNNLPTFQFIQKQVFPIGK